MAKGKDVVLATFAEEKGDTNALDEEVQRFLHIVGEGKGDTEMVSGGREVGDGAEGSGAVQAGVDKALEDVEVSVDSKLGG